MVKVQVSDEVKAAIEAGRAVVALESTIISHGMPYPQNVETARKVEEIVRSQGAIPATIGILGGVPIAGLSHDQIEILGKKGHDVAKVSRRDLPFVTSKRVDGATTVAATMIIADIAGIRLFATGGIGGVHRHAQQTFDISADLQELSRTDVAVVCAGAKSILDIGLTLEYLETHGVPVVAYRSDEFPAFYTRTSGFRVEYRCDEPVEIAMALHSKWSLGLHGGMVIGNPIPEAHSMEPALINGVIDRAVEEAELRGIKGKEMTPFLLSRIVELTGGESLESNIGLVFNNAALAARIAVELANIRG
ncbi:MAG TPA: pseudouridine-5'-phosphate glycosidase [Spirochaetia bacterium]|nr:pseudouridine-5'-phosphate glycosidase [Spirochaetia bacterium]